MLNNLFHLIVSIEGVASLTLWIAVVGRFIVLIRRGQLRLSADRHAWYMWVVYFCLAVASVFHLVDKHVLALRALASIERTAVAVVAFSFLIKATEETLPEGYVPYKWTWLFLVGGLTNIIYALAILTIPQPYGYYAASLAFAGYAIVMTTPIWRGAHNCFKHEQNPVMKLRMALMLATCYSIYLWMGNSILESVCGVLRISYDQDPVYFVAYLTILPAFVLSYLMPAHILAKVYKLLCYVRNIYVLVVIKPVEQFILSQSGKHAPLELTAREALLSPDIAIYSALISILDYYSVLEHYPYQLHQYLNRLIRDVVRAGLEYDTLVTEMFKIGLLYTLRALLAPLEPPVPGAVSSNIDFG